MQQNWLLSSTGEMCREIHENRPASRTDWKKTLRMLLLRNLRSLQIIGGASLWRLKINITNRRSRNIFCFEQFIISNKKEKCCAYLQGYEVWQREEYPNS